MNKTGIDKYAARLLMVSFFLPMLLQVLSVMVVSIYFIYRTLSEKQPIPRTNFVWAFVLSSGFLLYLFSFPFIHPDYTKVLRSLCEHKASFLIMPFVFAVIAPTFGQLIKREMTWFVYGCIAACIYANAFVFYSFYFGHSDIHTLSHVSYRVIFQRAIDIHPTYMGMYLCFSICILLYSAAFENPAGKIIKNILLCLLLIFLLAILAKSPLIALIMIFIHYAFTHRRSLYKYKMLFAGLLFTVAIAWFFIPFVSQRVNETLQYFSHNKNGNVVDNSVYARKQIWSVNMELLNHYWLTGVGPGRLYQTFLEHYLFICLGNSSIMVIHDPHNEYLFEWLSFGIIGIIVFAGIFLIYLVKAIRVRDHLNLYLLVILYITFFTETVLATQRGILFYAVFTALFFYLKPAPEQELN